MDLIVLDKDTFFPLGIADIYTSAIWTERYKEPGDVEIQLPLLAPIVPYMAIGNYLTLSGSDRTMIIESVELRNDSSTGERYMEYKGKSLESILSRRIVWHQTTLNGYLLTELDKILQQNLGNLLPNEESARRISNFRFVQPAPGSTEYELLSPIVISCQFTGDTLFDVVTSLSEACGFGWKITLNRSDVSNPTFDFSLFIPTNRTFSGDPTINPIIFSPEYDNLINSRYGYDDSKYKNITLVLGEDDGNSRKRKVVWLDSNEPSGLDRRELYTDARDLQSEKEDGSSMTPEQYEKSLETRGIKKLSENAIISVFDGEVEPNVGPKYGIDYFLGDYVSTMNEYGMGTVAQITEFIRSNSSDGYSEYPTFEMIN